MLSDKRSSGEAQFGLRDRIAIGGATVGLIGTAVLVTISGLTRITAGLIFTAVFVVIALIQRRRQVRRVSSRQQRDEKVR